MTPSEPHSQALPRTLTAGELPRELTSEFKRAVTKARAVVLWERLWPRLVPPAAITGLFLSASFAGIWGMATPAGRMAGVAAFALALAASPFRYKTGSLNVSRDEGLARLDKNLGDPLNPAQILGDRPADHSSAAEIEKWNHQTAQLSDKYAGKFKAGLPHPGMNAHDPHYMRFLVALTLAITASLSQAPHIEQVKKAFDWSQPAIPPPPVAPLQLKAWVTPPDGISIAPLQMTETTRDDTQGGEKMIAHQTSTLTIMTYGKERRIEVNGVVLPLQKTIPQGQGRTGYQYEVKLNDAKTTVVIAGGPRWNINVTQDRAPTISIDSIGASKDQDEKSLDIKYNAKDDQGYTGEIIIETPKGPDVGAKPLPSALPPVLTIN